jgi:hypothetical protein
LATEKEEKGNVADIAKGLFKKEKGHGHEHGHDHDHKHGDDATAAEGLGVLTKKENTHVCMGAAKEKAD